MSALLSLKILLCIFAAYGIVYCMASYLDRIVGEEHPRSEGEKGEKLGRLEGERRRERATLRQRARLRIVGRK